MIKEAELDYAFADMLASSPQFQNWLLSSGRFAKSASELRLLATEQQEIRRAALWWKHWWCRLPDGTEGETDIFAVFEADDGKRVALHIENKPPHGKLTYEQSVRYRRRAAYKAFDPSWLSYIDFECILLASEEFLDRHAECASLFDRCLSYEPVSRFVPLFGQAANGTHHVTPSS